MSFLSHIKPEFWDYQDVSTDSYRGQFNFRRIWLVSVLLTAGATLLPLLFVTLMDYQVTRKSIESEVVLRTVRLASNTRRAITFFLTERKQALDFVIHDNTYEELADSAKLSDILDNLKASYGGFVDLSVVNADGRQETYVGPYELEGRNYAEDDWFKNSVERGIYISDVFMGHRRVPHLSVAINREIPGGGFFLLRATLELEKINELLASLEAGARCEAFLINRQGVLQTPLAAYRPINARLRFAVPEYDAHTRILESGHHGFRTRIVGYAYIEGTPFILMVVLSKKEALESWTQIRRQILGIALGSVFVILLVILGIVTYLVNNLFLADQRRLAALHGLEYANKMATIGRLAAGVAHEINNPLAVISEKAGLIKDLFTVTPKYSHDEKVIRAVDAILRSVERGGAVTRRLLKFARHVEVKAEPLDMGDLLREVLGFLEKETQRLEIHLSVQIAEDLPRIESDRGKLQQIFLNVINNAIEAMQEGGRLMISARRTDGEHVAVRISDNGCGISQADLARVFDPFFSTKTNRGGTGLGLSITYGLVKEMGGGISVESRLGEGTTFTITLPLAAKERGHDARAAG